MCRKKLSFGKYSLLEVRLNFHVRKKLENILLDGLMCENKMEKRMRIDDLECSMFESPAKRSRPSPFVLSQAVPKRFLKAYTHVSRKKRWEQFRYSDGSFPP